MAKQTFFGNYYKFHGKGACPVFTLSAAHDQFVRAGYFGGRVECFKIGKIKKAFYYDFTSLCLDVGRQYLPYGEPEEINFWRRG